MGGWVGGWVGAWVGGWMDSWVDMRVISEMKPIDKYDRGCNAEETQGTLFLSPTLH